ncbi:uncharacterized protein [Venturia canescens]|uniref:uncharacterized protein n=1 Tax=Venturia canescens TaxID=32260 RepID=UPI001C9C96EE|nr:uncharacterized protein LOC122418510 [Venturia canescens]XP_043288696.1 uncharacterized protein LOC122418510 [Venturia canescens]
MVERVVCSGEEETNSARKIASCNVDREAGAHEVTGRLETHGKSRDPEAFKAIESLKRDRRESPIGGATGKFSLFKWFKRGSRDSNSWENRDKNSDRLKCNRDSSDLEENEIASELSSNESVETLYSTATVKSFAFRSGTVGKDPKYPGREHFPYDFGNTTTRSVGPFGVGASKITSKPELNRFDVTKTLPANVLSKRRDITARYSLQSCNGSSSGFGSCDHLASPRNALLDKRNDLNDRGSGRVHVRGKRRAPNPPIELARTKRNEDALKHPINRARGKRRPAPKPPEVKPDQLRISDNSVSAEKPLDPNSPTQKHTETPENSSASAALTVDKETGSYTPNQHTPSSDERLKRKTESVLQPDVKESEKSRRTRLEEIPIASEVTQTLEENESPASNPRNLKLIEISAQASPRTSNTVAENRSTFSDRKFEIKFDVTREQRESSPISTPARTKDDVRVLITDGENSEVSEEAKSIFDLPGSISNDSLVLRGGVLLSKRDINAPRTSGTSSDAPELRVNIARSKGRISVTTGSQTSMSAMPRPWYKRSVFEHSRDSGTSRRNDFLRNTSQPEAREEGAANASIPGNSVSKLRHIEKNQDCGTLSRLNFFHRSEKSTEERKKENKRKSGVSMLANISELDKEAAAIVQEEQARTRAASMLLQASKSDGEKVRNETEDIVQEMVTSAMESSPKRGTRALISKFNAIGNITKVTVNTSFFARQPYARDARTEKNEFPKNPRDNEWREKTRFEKSANVRTDKDLSRYFLPAEKVAKNRKVEGNGEKSSQVLTSNDISARLSFFQNVSAMDRNAHPENREISIEAKIDRLNEQVLSRRESNRDFENSPKFSRLRINGLNEESVKSSRQMSEESGKANCEVRKDFSDIFREIGIESRGKVSEQASSAASQVSKVLDILVEAEKNDRRRTSTGIKNSEDQDKEEKPKFPVTENPMKTDLREMLKEMKHSLPKRPKPSKTRDQQPAPKPEEKAEDKKSAKEKKKEFFLSATEKPALLSPVTVVCPPTIRNAPIFTEPAKPVCRETEDREHDRQKVSSAVQTCGNLRKKISAPQTKIGSPNSPKKDVSLGGASGSGIPGTSGLTKNHFQLIRPREFAQIEAIKTMKNGPSENTYANVIEQSLYANALVPPRHESNSVAPRNGETSKPFPRDKASEITGEINETETIGSQDSRTVESQNMNTLAVNRLLRKLEAAIASGHHQQAAGLAKELARLKIHCSVVRQRPKTKEIVNVNMYIEDKLAHQGPIPLRLTRSMTVAQLKAKVFTEFEIPTHVQRWIVGKNLADDDSSKLEDLQAVDGSPVFLYLVAPETKNDEAGIQDETVTLAEKIPPENDEHLQTKEVTKFVEIEESPKALSECQTINEEEDEESISEEVRMERYEALISLENCDVIPNSEPIECPICFVTYGPQEGVILRDCLHMFCRPCIANTIRYCEEAEVKCPFRDTEYTCESTLQEREIKSLVEPEVYQQHLAKSITQAENNAGNNAFHCKTPDCPGWCIYDDNVNNFLCPVCGVNNCLTCQVVHTGKNCRQYQEELRLSKETDHESKRTAAMLEEMVDRGEALPCPTCAVVLMKKWGCDWLRCSMCKTEICWVTRGPRWGPGGKGDTSGGCRCGEKGVKCHPRCNYCH